MLKEAFILNNNKNISKFNRNKIKAGCTIQLDVLKNLWIL